MVNDVEVGIVWLAEAANSTVPVHALEAVIGVELVFEVLIVPEPEHVKVAPTDNVFVAKSKVPPVVVVKVPPVAKVILPAAVFVPEVLLCLRL